jgi:Ca2+-transporting ATPase
MTPWHEQSAEAALRELGTDAAAGLSQAEAARRLAEHGHNELAGDGTKSAWLIF